MTASVFMAKRGALSMQDKAELRKAKIVVVEIDSLDDARFIHAEEIIPPQVMLKAAIQALASQPPENTPYTNKVSTADRQRAEYFKILGEMWAATK